MLGAAGTPFRPGARLDFQPRRAGFLSIVVAVQKAGRTCVAADSQSNFGSLKVPVDNARARKIRRVGPMVLGTTGWALYEDIFEDFLQAKDLPQPVDKPSIFSFFLELWKDLHERYPFVNDQVSKDESPFGNLDATFVIAGETGIFYVASDLGVTRFDRYFAIGSGADFAMGALHQLIDQDLDADTIATRAVETAIAFNIYCGGEIQTLSTG